MKGGGLYSRLSSRRVANVESGELKKKNSSVKLSFTEKCLFRSKFIGETKTRCAQLLSFGN